ncbi:MAG: hypothetical protein M9904_17430 [Chitinophagaceae bacterium]|nr:hypothetical protein [Chitinophagaceae bacterium]
MRQLAITLLTFWTISVYGQDYPFAKTFIDGTIILKDSTQLKGQLKWYPHQNEKLKFRVSENAEIKKYSPEDLISFTTDTLKFVSLFDLEVYSDNYALLGKTSKIKHTFGQLLDSGSFNIYFVLITGVDAISGAIQPYPNFYFEKKVGNNYVSAAYPFAMRMKEKKYEKAKDNLYTFFKDYPQIIEKIKSYKKQDDFFEIIDLMKKEN